MRRFVSVSQLLDGQPPTKVFRTLCGISIALPAIRDRDAICDQT